MATSTGSVELDVVKISPSIYGQRHRWLFLAAAIFFISTQGGVVYGWPSMRAIMRRNDILLPRSCNATPPVATGAPQFNSTELCIEQELDFGLIYTVGAWANQGGRFGVGVFLDLAGPRLTLTLCALLFAAGCAIFGSSFSSVGGLACGFLLIGVGGAGIQLSIQSVSALFPRNRSTAMASLSGAFQFASGFYLLFDVLNREANLALGGLMVFHCCLALAVCCLAFAMLPDQPFGTATSRTSRAKRGVARAGGGEGGAAKESGGAGEGDAALPLKSRPFRSQAMSTEFLSLVTFFSIGMLQAQFTVATIGLQLERKGDATGVVTRTFSSCLACSFLYTPFHGVLIDRAGFGLALATTNTILAAAISFLLIPTLAAAYVTSVLYAMGRVSLWATYFSYVAAVFGFSHFGKLVGGGLLLGACVSLLQYPLISLTLQMWGGDFTPVNVIFLALHALAYTVVPRLGRGARKQLR
jgi:MFS family permease